MRPISETTPGTEPPYNANNLSIIGIDLTEIK